MDENSPIFRYDAVGEIARTLRVPPEIKTHVAAASAARMPRSSAFSSFGDPGGGGGGGGRRNRLPHPLPSPRSRLL